MSQSFNKSNYARPRYTKKAKWERLLLKESKKRNYGLGKYQLQYFFY